MTLKRKTRQEDPVITHWLNNPNEDPIINRIHGIGFENDKDSRVTVIYVPCYLNGTDGIFNQSYYDLLIGMDATVFPSYYEPWGYTPLESVAFGVPTVTTTLSGFGQWILSSFKNDFDDCGVNVIARGDYNYNEVSEQIAQSLKYLVDCGEHTWDSLRISGADASKITNVFITHLHDDHFNIENIRKVASLGKICLWVNENAPIEEENNIEIVKMKPFQKYNVDGDFTITALPSNHDPESFPVHFLIEGETNYVEDHLCRLRHDGQQPHQRFPG
jgi:hypothetical protein